MNPRSLLVILVASTGIAYCQPEAASVPPGSTVELKPATVLQLMEHVADWQLANPSAHEPTDWTQAAGDAGMMALADISASPRFLEAMRKMADGNGWKLGPRPYVADDHCVGQAYAELFFRFRDPAMVAPMREQFDWVLAHPKKNGLDFDATRNPDRLDRWSWCDSLFMAPPAWVRLSAATGAKAYLEFAVENWWQTSDFLYDRDEHLYFRDSTYFAKRETNGEKIFWSRGNGWVLAGLVRVLQYLPADHPAHPRFLRQYREMADRILRCQQPDGLWRSSLLDPKNYPLKETSGSGFYCYALAWGVNQGLLARPQFEPAVSNAWKGLAGCVTGEGRLTHVQPIGADPKRFDENATEIYGVGAFLLAGSEVYRLLEKGPAPEAGQSNAPSTAR
jgi:rhamnogalacturonyl hydrolase YesR